LTDLDEPGCRCVVDLQRRVVDVEALLEHPLELAPHRVTVIVAPHEHVRRE
jgi:hypothetical protein